MTETRPALALRTDTTGERAATPVELLFDLCFVVAVAFLAQDLHHGISDGHAGEAVLAYAGLFVPVWWAWMSFTWFATAFDNDDAVHRLLTMAQMVGVVALAATVHRAAGGDTVAFGVAVAALRVPLVAQWLRAARHDPAHGAFARTYALGLAAGAVVWWAGSRLEPPAMLPVLAVAVGIDLLTPVLAVRRSPDPVFHAGHVAERYGLFTIIVIGESVLSMSVALESWVDGPGSSGALLAVSLGGGAIAFSLWWVYFGVLGRDGLTRHRRAAFVWGYGHYLLFAAVAAVGAGVQVQVDVLLDHASTSETVAVAAVGLPAALAVAAIAWLQVAANRQVASAWPLGVGAVALLLVLAVPDVATATVAAAAVVIVTAAVAVRRTAGSA